MPHQDIGKVLTRVKDAERLPHCLRLPNGRCVALGTGQCRAEEAEEISPRHRRHVFAARDFVQRGRLAREALQDLLVRLIGCDSFDAAPQCKLHGGNHLPLPRLLLEDHPLVDFRHRSHPTLNSRYQIRVRTCGVVPTD
jgi:hypothetical protein